MPAARRLVRLFLRAGIVPLYNPLALSTDPNRIWTDWRACLAADPGLAATSWPRLVGRIIDAHAPRMRRPLLTPCQLYRAGAAPDQTVDTLQVDPRIIRIVANLWAPKVPIPRRQTAYAMPFTKLVEKGKMNPKSVRYISPQIGRCRACATSNALTVMMLKAWLLGDYAHRTNSPGPAMRFRVMACTFDELHALVVDQPSKCLYNIIAECIAAVTLHRPDIHMAAAAVNPDFKVYADSVFANASTIADSTLRRLVTHAPVPRRRLKLRPVVFRDDRTAPAPTARRVFCIEAAPDVAAAQTAACTAATGIDRLDVYICHSCTTVHVPVTAASRASKTRLGISLNLSTLEAECNACGAGRPTRVNLAGQFVTGLVRGVQVTATCCTVCGMAVTTPSFVGNMPQCRACVPKRRSVVCLCGAEPAVASKSTVVGLGAEAAAYAACSHHASAFAELAVNPTASLADGNAFLALHARMCAQ